jgi:hypothetical protein
MGHKDIWGNAIIVRSMSNLDLIDWRLVGFSALWLSGLSAILAAFSFGDYTASQRHLRTREVLSWPGYQVAFNGGLVLFCLGLMGRAQMWWQQGLWAVLALGFSYQTWSAWRRHTHPDAPSN